jgi:hypothetical protein
MCVSCNTASGLGNSASVQVFRASETDGTLSARESLTNFIVTLGPTDTYVTNLVNTQTFFQGDALSTYIQCYGGAANTLHDLIVQLDLF